MLLSDSSTIKMAIGDLFCSMFKATWSELQAAGELVQYYNISIFVFCNDSVPPKQGHQCLYLIHFLWSVSIFSYIHMYQETMGVI